MAGVRLFFVKNLLSRLKSRVDYRDIMFARRGFERVAGRFNTPLSGFNHQAWKLGDLKVEWVTPEHANEKKVLLYFHGGGYTTGSINTHRALVSQIIKGAGIKALMIEYRLAPEHKYPCAVEDAAMAYQWLLDNGYSANDICFGGDSAGGGLTLATLLYVRDKGMPLPKCAIALSPWTDHTLSGRTYVTNKDIDPMLVAEGFPVWSKHYTGDEDPQNPYISPLFGDLHDLPPVYIQVGEEEMLLDDSLRFAEKAKAAGVDITIDVYAGMFHVFNAFWLALSTAKKANIKLGEFLKAQMV